MILVLLALLTVSANIYVARVDRVIDGDTIAVTIPIWPQQSVTTLIRLIGIDTPELKGRCPKERTLALEAAAFLSKLLPAGSSVQISAVKMDKFGGRYDGVALLGGVSVNAILIENGYAEPYDGKGPRRDWCAS